MRAGFEFAFEIDDTVTIVPLSLPGRVLQRCDRGAGQHDYQVVYWADGKRCVEWLLPHEISHP